MSGIGNKSPPFWPAPPPTRGHSAFGTGMGAGRGRSMGMGPGMGGLSGGMGMGMDEPRLGRDDVIKGTDDDAIISKLSAVNLGYLDDSFVKYFVKRPSRRPPLINRGSYLRTRTLDTLTEDFIKAGASGHVRKQIVSLGCGSDTRYFKFKAKGLSAQKYFEIDFPESTAKKSAVIKKNKAFTDIIADPELKLGMGGTELYAKDYCLLSGDLREFVGEIVPKLTAQGFDKGLPTLFLSECVLIYIEPRDSDTIVEWVGTNMTASMFAVYEQINPTDAFGAMMLRNLKARSIELPGIHAYPSLMSQEQRFLARGWHAAKAVDMNSLHESLSEGEHKRISALEIFDEVEEWQLLANHYCIAWAYQVQKESNSHAHHDKDSLVKLFSDTVATHSSKPCVY